MNDDRSGSRPSPALLDVADAIAGCARPAQHAVAIAVDGVDGVGKTTFADRLAPLCTARGVTAHRVSIDDFHFVREHRYRRGRRDPVGYVEDSFDHDAFVRLVLEPLRPGSDGWIHRRHHDLASDRIIDEEPVLVRAGEVVIVDGVFLQSPVLRPHWALTVFLDAPFEVTVPRAIARDEADDRHARERATELALERYVPGQERYLERCRPRERADIVVDATEPEHATVVRPR